MALKKKENNSLPSPPPNSDVLINDDMVCKSCGSTVFRGMKFCEDCGQRLDWGE